MGGREGVGGGGGGWEAKGGLKLVSRSQTHYALANLPDGAFAVKGLGTKAWLARASCNYSCSTNQIAAFSKLAYFARDVYEENV